MEIYVIVISCMVILFSAFASFHIIQMKKMEIKNLLIERENLIKALVDSQAKITSLTIELLKKEFAASCKKKPTRRW